MGSLFFSFSEDVRMERDLKAGEKAFGFSLACYPFNLRPAWKFCIRLERDLSGVV